MSKIRLHNNDIESIFELLGYNEDSISYSVAWVLSKSESLLKLLVKDVTGCSDFVNEEVQIIVQRSELGLGRTDIEITDNNEFHIIIEAKRGWILPPKEQFEMYSKRETFCFESKAKRKVLVSLSECSRLYADHYQEIKEANGIGIKHVSWKDIFDYSTSILNKVNHSEKRLLRELQHYLGRLMNMQNQSSNLVYVVSLGASKPVGCDLTWIEIVTKKNRYFHPVGHNWPKEPPTYIAFRYAGKLQSIHHIDSYTVTKDIHTDVEEVPSGEQEFPHFVYTMGPAIIPTKTVRTGNLFRAQRVWAHLDTLLTSDSIVEARDITKSRLATILEDFSDVV